MYNKEVVLCSNCKGEGELHTSRVTNYHKGEYEVITTECTKCDGKGRLWEITKKEYQKL